MSINNCYITIEIESESRVETMVKEIYVEDIPYVPANEVTYARVTKTVGLSVDYSSRKVSTTISIVCPQTTKDIETANEVAYHLARKYTSEHLNRLVEE
jgi:hypothetical protein